MKITGVHDDQPSIGDGLNDVENCTFYVKGQLGRRLGFGARIANTGIVVGEIGSSVVFITSTGTIEVTAQ